MAKKNKQQKSRIIKFCLSVLPVIGMLTIGGALCFIDIPQENEAYLTLILGALIALAKEASGYYFQPDMESSGEADRDSPKINDMGAQVTSEKWSPPSR